MARYLPVSKKLSVKRSALNLTAHIKQTVTTKFKMTTYCLGEPRMNSKALESLFSETSLRFLFRMVGGAKREMIRCLYMIYIMYLETRELPSTENKEL